METLRSYAKSEEAYTDAALLSGMGIDALVIDESALGGNVLGGSGGSIRIEVPPDQIGPARKILERHPRTILEPEEPPQTPFPNPKRTESRLVWIFRTILILNIAICVLPFLFEEQLYPPHSKELEKELIPYLPSESMWVIATSTYWPLVITIAVGNLLCLFFLRAGRIIFAFSVVWSLATTPGIDPYILTPLSGFLGGLDWLLTGFALALMFWSPLRRKFSKAPIDP